MKDTHSNKRDSKNNSQGGHRGTSNNSPNTERDPSNNRWGSHNNTWGHRKNNQTHYEESKVFKVLQETGSLAEGHSHIHTDGIANIPFSGNYTMLVTYIAD